MAAGTTPGLKLDEKQAQAISNIFGANALVAGQGLSNLFYGNPTTTAGVSGRVDATRSRETTDNLNQWKQLATQGYNAPQMQGMREQAARSMDSQYKTQLHQQALAASRNRVRGPAAMAMQGQLNQQRLQAQGEMEQGLMVKNADFMAQNLNQYTGQMNYAQGKEYERNLENLNRMWAERVGGMGTLTQTLSSATATEAMRKQNRLGQKMVNKI